jgi:hypothetical protein
VSRAASPGGGKFAPSVPDLVFCGVALLFALGASVRLTQSDGDLFAHIRLGEAILATHRAPATSLFGIMTDGVAMVSPAWLSEILFALAYRVGGLALIAALIAVIAGATHALVAIFLRKRGVDARLALTAALLSVLLSASHWLARPHAFSILAAAVLVVLLEWDDLRSVGWIALVMLLWTNLHGGWVYGIGIIALYALGDVIDSIWRKDPSSGERSKTHLFALGAAAVVTLVNPYGVTLHAEVFKTLTDSSLGAAIVEYQPPSFTSAADLPFLIALLVSAIIVVLSRARLRAAWLLVIAANCVLALQARRNIALFGVTAWPLLTLQGAMIWREWIARQRIFSSFALADRAARVGTWAIPTMIAILAIGTAGGSVIGRSLMASTPDPTLYPVEAVARMRTSGITGRIFTEWTWGGYLVLAWPAQKAFLDPLKFDGDNISDYSAIAEALPQWRDKLEHWNVSVIVVGPRAPLARAVVADSAWRRWHEDSTAIVFLRAGADVASGPLR